MLQSQIINNSQLFFTDEYETTLLGPYYNYVLENLKKILKNYNSEKKISFGAEYENSDIKIDFQIEHTIHYNTQTNERTVMLQNYEKLSHNDIIIEYSKTNIENLKTSTIGKKFLKKTIYCPPIIYDEIKIDSEKSNNVMVIQNFSKRRAELFQKFNVDCIYTMDKDKLTEVYSNYKILMNTHQIDEHQTIEELRILPALINGVLIVSEKGPFYEKIPYQKHVIWTDYDNIVDDTKNTLKNYHHIRNQKFKFLNKTIKKMKNTFENDLKKKLEKLL